MRTSTSHRRPRQAGPGQGGDGGGAAEGGGGGDGGGGDLVKVAFASSLMEAEMIQGLLSEHGIPSLLKRGPGFDVPEFIPAGPRQVFVAREAAPRAREVLEGMPGAC
ncbi:MAG TPA: DUF2007 domain-containing protein [Solirubrobacterales bacterium]|nr:DUF2007 domain-containing protein [Solirubrobacterales bacterium]